MYRFMLLLLFLFSSSMANEHVFLLMSPSVLKTKHTHVGTGFNLKTPAGSVVTVTAAHVCAYNEHNLLIADFDNPPWSFLHILALDPEHDLCFLEPAPDHPPLNIAVEAFEHQAIHTVGFPHGGHETTTYGMSLEMKTGMAKDTGIDAYLCGGAGAKLIEKGKSYFCIRQSEVVSSSMEVHPGNSGGPVINENNEVVGVLESEDPRTNRGYFIPLTPLWQLLSKF